MLPKTARSIAAATSSTQPSRLNHAPVNAAYVCSPAMPAKKSANPNHTIPFEMSAVRARFDGFDIRPPFHWKLKHA